MTKKRNMTIGWNNFYLNVVLSDTSLENRANRRFHTVHHDCQFLALLYSISPFQVKKLSPKNLGKIP